LGKYSVPVLSVHFFCESSFQSVAYIEDIRKQLHDATVSIMFMSSSVCMEQHNCTGKNCVNTDLRDFYSCANTFPVLAIFTQK
jgi:hypothetical protein